MQKGNEMAQQLTDPRGKELVFIKRFSYTLDNVRFTVETPIVQETNEKGFVNKRGSEDNTFNIYPHLQWLYPRG